MDYHHTFPHLFTFPVTLDSADANLRAFADGTPLDDAGVVHLTQAAPIRDVLTPAACYHLYVRHQGVAFKQARYFTTRNVCFRRETHYEPLRRQWSFNMREIVCIGGEAEVQAFLATMHQRADELFNAIRLPIAWQNATDPFFNPSRSAKFIAQKLSPVKFEMTLPDNLAIGSTNFHRNYFGDAFKMEHGGQPAFTGCIAFGLERWLFAWISTFGPDPSGWPNIEGAG
jgi:seryl-tRNA synthetase